MAGQTAEDIIDRLVGMKVYDIASHKLGKVVEVRMDDATGEVECVIVEEETLMGLRKHRFAVAWNMVTYSETRHALVFAPGVHRDHEEHLPPPQDRAPAGATA